MADGGLPPVGQGFAGANPRLAVEPGHDFGVGEHEDFFLFGDGIDAFCEHAFSEFANFGFADSEFCEGFAVFGVQAFFAEQGDMDCIDVRIQDGLGDAGVGSA